MEPFNDAPQSKDISQSQQRPPVSRLIKKKDDITPKIG